MNPEIHHCIGISSKPLSFFFQSGSSKRGKKVLILGESLSKTGWIDSGKAFYTIKNKLVPTGKRLNEELALINLRLEECAFTEIAKCYLGKNRKLLSTCGSLCAPHLLDQFHHFKPKVLLSLGVITKDILGEIFKTNLSMGKMREITYKNKIYIILPLYHPSPANPFGHAKNNKILAAQKRKMLLLL